MLSITNSNRSDFHETNVFSTFVFSTEQKASIKCSLQNNRQVHSILYRTIGEYIVFSAEQQASIKCSLQKNRLVHSILYRTMGPSQQNNRFRLYRLVYTTGFARVGRSSNHHVRCRSWRYSKRHPPRSVVLRTYDVVYTTAQI